MMRSLIFAMTFILLGGSAFPALADDVAQSAEIVVIRPVERKALKQGLPVFQGISDQSAGARAISMNKVVIPPGAAAKAHIHKGYETAIYVIKGRVKTLYGPGLKKSVINEGGDFIYIPPDIPHKPINLSETEEVIAIVARTDPNEQESVELVDVPDDSAN